MKPLSTRPLRPSSSSRSSALLVGLALVLLGCGGGGDGDGSVDGVLRVVGQDNLQWDVTELSAPAGTITFELTCEPGVNHNLVIDETGEQVAACAPGATSTGSVELEAGTYTYVCTVPGHEVTMRGVLAVL
jgi:cytochrome c oxidase subunit II